MISITCIRFVLQLYISFISISIRATSASDSSSDQQSIYEVLHEHGLPMGLLPKGVKEFNVDVDGQFWVHLDQACNAKFESELHYDTDVSGNLSYGRIGELSGIEAQDLFLWFPVKGIQVDMPSSGLIYFDVGVVRKEFSLSLFETPLDCVVVGSEKAPDFRDGSFTAEAVSKIQSGQLRYKLDQGNFARNVI
ncbi:Protein of unknown function, DUF538 [Quillaja saponaria]|uniref:DUF538 family protein n=1 Tax=Quillaja saponaria TaxID=32244 RepID=A0AAD7L341_QUISA|nr:Protein of unknown function, DUF538 [Quillaja saponaria]KAJ7950571.1 Protein of unknown function, DUF538 [Quillaja saponaria]